MNAREKNLAIGVGSLVGLLVLWFAWSTYSGMVEHRKKLLNAATKSVRDKQSRIDAAAVAKKKIAEITARALPKDVATASSLYQSWLLKLTQSIGLEKVAVAPQQVTIRKETKQGQNQGDVLQILNFNIDGEMRLDQLTKLLFEFYKSNMTHRIFVLDIAPGKQSKMLRVQMKIEALSLLDAVAKSELPAGTSKQLVLPELADYNRDILGRNLFGPANRPPRIPSLSAKKTPRGESFTASVDAKDSDTEDVLNYTLEAGSPEGARIDARSGKISWTPKANGDYKFNVAVSDNGTPVKTSRATFDVTVVDPPPPKVEVVKQPDPPKTPPKPSFDEASQAFVTALTRIDNTQEVEITIRTRANAGVIRLQPGERIEIGTISGTVEAVDARGFEFRTAKGQLYRVKLGRALLDQEPLSD